jgi:hypothetical protein
MGCTVQAYSCESENEMVLSITKTYDDNKESDIKLSGSFVKGNNVIVY